MQLMSSEELTRGLLSELAHFLIYGNAAHLDKRIEDLFFESLRKVCLAFKCVFALQSDDQFLSSDATDEL